MRINYIRHGKTIVNFQHRVSGRRTDDPLCQEGLDEIRENILRGIYPREPFECYTSCLQRTQQTLRLVYPDRPFTISPLLNERDFGLIEYETDLEVINRWRVERVDERGEEIEEAFSTIGGESTLVFTRRVLRDFTAFLDECYQPDKTITIFGHGGYLRQLFPAFEVPGLARLRPRIRNGFGAVFRVERVGAAYRLTVEEWIGSKQLEDIVEEDY